METEEGERESPTHLHRGVPEVADACGGHAQTVHGGAEAAVAAVRQVDPHPGLQHQRARVAHLPVVLQQTQNHIPRICLQGELGGMGFALGNRTIPHGEGGGYPRLRGGSGHVEVGLLLRKRRMRGREKLGGCIDEVYEDHDETKVQQHLGTVDVCRDCMWEGWERIELEADSN